MPEPAPLNTRSDRRWLAILFIAALLVRIVAALVVEYAARAKGSLCLFDDTAIYWKLADATRHGGPYVVDQFGVPHFALRTPGYPLFLAVCQWLFGADNTLAPRLVQALLGAVCVILVYYLTRRVWPTERGRSAALAAAVLAAFEPYWAATSALLLSEAVFVPLMLLTLWGMAACWHTEHVGRGSVLAGAAAGAAILVKPSWALAPPLLFASWMLLDRTRASVRGAVIATVALVAIMSPWWIRNAQVLGRFVPTALWAGASLYDGLNPHADGSSDMRFLAAPEFRGLNEIEQDQALRDAALSFARTNPSRFAALAAIKAARFWSPWPNAAEFRATATNLASAAVTLPIFALLLIGLYDSRREVQAWILLAGPLLYFFALHCLFVSSIRYRIPAMVPAFGLVGAGLRVLFGRRLAEPERRSS
jgi:4-amino-4-deoxy-L-arabinose transferase-like glycosyltransferase